MSIRIVEAHGFDYGDWGCGPHLIFSRTTKNEVEFKVVLDELMKIDDVKFIVVNDGETKREMHRCWVDTKAI